MPRQQRRQLQLPRHLHGLGLILTGAVQQLLLHRIGHEQRPCVLRQHAEPLPLCQLHLATIGLLEICQRLQQRGLAHAVAAQQAQQLALPERHIRAAKNVFAFFGISEPKFLALLGEKASGDNYAIGIQKPFAASGTSLGVIKVKDASVVSSGIYERYYRIGDKIYHHILDTTTGYPIENDLYQVTIISKSSMDGDALSTTCFALGLEEGMNLIENTKDTEAIFVTNDGNPHCSSGIGNTVIFEEN